MYQLAMLVVQLIKVKTVQASRHRPMSFTIHKDPLNQVHVIHLKCLNFLFADDSIYSLYLRINLPCVFFSLSLLFFSFLTFLLSFLPCFLLRPMPPFGWTVHEAYRKIGSIADYDPLNDNYGSIANGYRGPEPVFTYYGQFHMYLCLFFSIHSINCPFLLFPMVLFLPFHLSLLSSLLAHCFLINRAFTRTKHGSTTTANAPATS